MSSKIFNVGDVVMLKSGGQQMTVNEITQQFDNGKPLEGYDCKCVWFIGDELRHDWFDQLSLKKYTPYSSNPSNRILS